MLEHMGLGAFKTLDHAARATLIPLGLNATLFLGPLLQRWLDDEWGSLADIPELLSDWRFLRQAVVAPVTEEIVFRGAVVPLIAPLVSSQWALCLTAPLAFGVAHLHHAIEGAPIPMVLAQFG